MRKITLMTLAAAALALTACGADSAEAGKTSTSRGGPDITALAALDRGAVVETDTFLATCKTFVNDVPSIPHNEGEPNPMDVMRSMGADAYCGCNEEKLAAHQARKGDANSKYRAAQTIYMAKVIANHRDPSARHLTRPSLGAVTVLQPCYEAAIEAHGG